MAEQFELGILNRYTIDKRSVQCRVASPYVQMHECGKACHEQLAPKADSTTKTSLTVTALSPSMSYSQMEPVHPNSEHRQYIGHGYCTVLVTSSGHVGGSSSSGSMTPLQLLSLPSLCLVRRVHRAVGVVAVTVECHVPAGATLPQKYWAKNWP